MSNARGDADSFVVSYSLVNPQGYKSGRYKTNIKYLLEEIATGNKIPLEVFNLGVEVTADQFISKAEEVGADVIGLSSLLTMSMDFQKQVIEELKNRGLRDKYKIIVGGSPTSEDWAEQIGADGWADDAIEAVELIKKLLE